MTLRAGTRLHVYEITGPLGAGGMGEVFRARDTRLNRDVAIKMLPDSVALDQGGLPASSAKQGRWQPSTIPTSRRSTGSRTPLRQSKEQRASS